MHHSRVPTLGKIPGSIQAFAMAPGTNGGRTGSKKKTIRSILGDLTCCLLHVAIVFILQSKNLGVETPYEMKERNPFAPYNALESFRNHDFDAVSSICEIIDNSIESHATEIKILFEWAENPEDTESRFAKKYVFIDNGDGMDERILYDYLILGESEKKALSEGIGKYGVGATLSGISVARHIDAFSKVSGGKWMHTFLDLDSIKQGKLVPKPFPKEPPIEFSKNLEHGTIIIWENIDKIQVALKEEQLFEIPSTKSTELHNEDCLETEVGRIYRKFISDKFLKEGRTVENKNKRTILIQEKIIEPYDPLYATYNPKQTDGRSPTVKYRSFPIRLGNISGKMHITTSYLPDKWWVDQYRPGIDTDNLKRKIGSRNEGLSLVRERREIFFGKLPYFRINDPGGERGAHSFLEQDRFTGFEIEFGRDVDDIFGIQINKSRLNVSKEIRKKISNMISPTIVTRRDNWRVKRSQANKGKTDPTGPGKGKKKIHEKTNPDYDDDQKKALKQIAKKYVKNKNDKAAVEAAYEDLVKGYLPIASYDFPKNAPMVSFDYEIDSIIVRYNMNHPFLKKFTEALGDIGVKLGTNSSNALEISENQTLRTLLDILFVSFGHALVSYENLSKSQEIQTTLNTLQNTWSDRANAFSRKNLESTQN